MNAPSSENRMNAPSSENRMNAPSSFTASGRRPRLWAKVALIALVLAGSYLRIAGRDWDNSNGLHPDERFMMMVTESLRLPPAGTSYFDATRSTLNPHVNGTNLFVYGTLPLFLVGSAYRTIGRPFGLDIYQVGRPITAAFDIGTLILVALLGLALLGDVGAVFATAAYAFSVIPIQLSHFYTVDPYAAFFCLLAIAFALRASAATRRSTFRNGVLGFGFALGCAAASKVSLAPVSLLLPLALWLRDRRLHEGPGMLPEDRRGRWWRLLWPSLAAASIAFIVFRIAQPYAFSGPGFFGLRPNPRWLANMEDIRRLSIPGVGFPPNIQWYARAPWFPLEQMALWGLNPLVFLGALVGGAAVAWKNLRRDRWNALALLWIWCVVNFLLFGALAGVKYLRYQLPIYGCACLLFGYAVARLPVSSLMNRAMERLGALRVRALGTTYGVLAITAAVVWALAFTSIYRAPVTRIEASSWILRHWPGPLNLVVELADGSTVLDPIGLRGGLLPDRLELAAHQDGTVRELFIHRVKHPDSPVSPKTSIPGQRQLASTSPTPRTSLRFQLTRLDPGSSGPVTAAFTGELRFVDGVAESIHLTPDVAFPVRKAERLLLTANVTDVPSGLRFEGTRIAHETSWDDTLPMRIEGWDPYGGIYVADVKFELYDPQLDRIVDTLFTADTISISSNRVYGTITRMGRDFPIVDRFYRTLLPCPKNLAVAECYRNAAPGTEASPFGFRLDKTFTRNPKLGPLEIPDQRAEEAFTVYDHPRVLLFRREARVSREELVRLLTTNFR